MQIEFINYTKDYTEEQSVFYFEDVTEALAWYSDYTEQYPDDEVGCTYFSAYGTELVPSVDMLEEFEELAKTHDDQEIEAGCILINYGYDDTLRGALDTLNDQCYFIQGHTKLDAFENFLDEIDYLHGVPEFIRWHIDFGSIMRNFEYDGMTILELGDYSGTYLMITH